MLRFFPNDVASFEPVVALLAHLEEQREQQRLRLRLEQQQQEQRQPHSEAPAMQGLEEESLWEAPVRGAGGPGPGGSCACCACCSCSFFVRINFLICRRAAAVRAAAVAVHAGAHPL